MKKKNEVTIAMHINKFIMPIMIIDSIFTFTYLILLFIFKLNISDIVFIPLFFCFIALQWCTNYCRNIKSTINEISFIEINHVNSEIYSNSLKMCIIDKAKAIIIFSVNVINIFVSNVLTRFIATNIDTNVFGYAFTFIIIFLCLFQALRTIRLMYYIKDKQKQVKGILDDYEKRKSKKSKK